MPRTTKPAKVNVRLLRLIQKDIADHSEQFDMREYVGRKGELSPENLCGTTFCIAGDACLKSIKTFSPRKLKGMFIEINDKYGWSNSFDFEEEACKLLGLSEAQGEALFHSENWPEPYCQRYIDAEYSDNHKQMAKAGVARIEHLIKTGE